MELIIERIEKGHFWKFHGGIHPPQNKFLTKDKPIRQLPLPKQLILPLRQHIGQPGQLLVAVGDKVLKGQALTLSTGVMAVPIHAPTSGTITKIAKSVVAHPSGLSEACIFLCPDGEEKWITRHVCNDFTQLSRATLIDKIASAGIAGMGGAGFPSHIKVNSDNAINYLIINAAECEPYITADDLLIREHSTAVVDGIRILDTLLKPAFILIGIEDNKGQAINALQQATKHIEKVKVCVLPTKYPTGGEKQLIKVLTGKEVPSGVLPSSLGIIMQNVATCFAIADAVINDKPLLHRVVTVSGQALAKPQNVWAMLGTPISDLLQQCAYIDHGQPQDKQHLIMGGPMMGFSLPNTQVPVVKTTNCILAPSSKEIPDNNKEVECIRCGQCAEVCPSQLLPQELQWSAKAKDYPQLEKLNLFDCIDCGACAYVCPSQIPLVQYYRVAKAEMRQQQILDRKADKAKLRFEARKARLEKDKLARELKQQNAAAARREAMNKSTPGATKVKSAVADALARVKAKKALAANSGSTSEPQADREMAKTTSQGVQPDDKKIQVAAAIARRKAKKLAQSQDDDIPLGAQTDNQPEKANTALAGESDQISAQHQVKKEDKKQQVAAAIARRKAKKQAEVADAEGAKKQKKIAITESETESGPDIESTSTDILVKKTDASVKKERIALAIINAKAKAAARKQQKLE